MALGNALANRPKQQDANLNITSMMDMFTIIVFFLLFSYAEKPDEFDVDKNVQLPESSSQFSYKNSVKLFLSENQVKLEKEPVATISQGKVVGLDVNNPQSSNLYIQLKKYKEKQLADAKLEATEKGEEPKTDFHVLFFCDRQLSFKTMNSIIKVAGMAGYPNFQLAVLEQ